MNVRPSSLPILKECPRFESGPARDYTNTGTLRHEALEARWNSDDQVIPEKFINQLDDESIEGINWAFEFIKMDAPMSDHALHIERKLEIQDEDFKCVMSGTLDYSCGPNLYDIKWRKRNYKEQMAAYALMLIQESGWPEVTVNLLFMECKRRETYTLNRQECVEIIEAVVEKVEDLNAKPTPCDYCGWCGKIKECEAMTERVNAINEGCDWNIDQFDAEKLNEPGEIAKAYEMAVAVKKWVDAIQKHTRDHMASGGEVTGYELKERQGRRFIDDIRAAFELSGLDQSAFLECCEPSFTKIVERRKAIHGQSKAAATRETEEILGEAIKRKPPTQAITKKKAQA